VGLCGCGAPKSALVSGEGVGVRVGGSVDAGRSLSDRGWIRLEKELERARAVFARPPPAGSSWLAELCVKEGSGAGAASAGGGYACARSDAPLF
jgi:hypothetical protein